MANKQRFHPALTVANFKNCIPITLKMEKVLYTSWAELFKIHCRVYQVISHILPHKPSASTSDKAPKVDAELWSRLDAIVLQWIYCTISSDLMHTIIETDATAQQAWERLAGIFQDNKHSRALYLENQFNHVTLDSFPNISAYCQELKMLSDQLSNVGAPVLNQRLVLQLIVGLNENYDGVATLIQQSNPLPQFFEARSKLILEETRKAKRAATQAVSADTALLTSNSSSSAVSQGSKAGSVDVTFRTNNEQRPSSNRGNHRGRGRDSSWSWRSQHRFSQEPAATTLAVSSTVGSDVSALGCMGP